MLTISPGLFVMMIPALVFAQNSGSHDDEMFKAIDTDASGDLNVKELQGAFVKYDSDHDGVVTWDEYSSKHSILQFTVKDVWDVYDLNRDGRLTQKEYVKMHDLIDFSNNGMVEKKEFFLRGFVL